MNTVHIIENNFPHMVVFRSTEQALPRSVFHNLQKDKSSSKSFARMEMGKNRDSFCIIFPFLWRLECCIPLVCIGGKSCHNFRGHNGINLLCTRVKYGCSNSSVYLDNILVGSKMLYVNLMPFPIHFPGYSQKQFYTY